MTSGFLFFLRAMIPIIKPPKPVNKLIRISNNVARVSKFEGLIKLRSIPGKTKIINGPNNNNNGRREVNNVKIPLTNVNITGRVISKNKLI